VVTGLKKNGGNLNNIRCEASSHFRNKKMEDVKDKINELAMNSKNKVNICLLNFPIQNGLKQDGGLPSLLFKFALEYAIMKVQETQVRLK
jgi:hypothetical protein